MRVFFLVLALSVACTLSLPQPQGPTPEIVLYESDGDERSYNFKYETSDGIARAEKGVLKDSGNPDDPTLLSVEGSYTYTDDLGKSHQVSYIADENGYRVLSST